MGAKLQQLQLRHTCVKRLSDKADIMPHTRQAVRSQVHKHWPVAEHILGAGDNSLCVH